MKFIVNIIEAIRCFAIIATYASVLQVNCANNENLGFDSMDPICKELLDSIMFGLKDDKLTAELKHDIKLYQKCTEEEVNSFASLALLKTFILCNNRKIKHEKSSSKNSNIIFSNHEIEDIIAPFFVDDKIIEKVHDNSCSLSKLKYPANTLKWFFAQQIRGRNDYSQNGNFLTGLYSQPARYDKFRNHDHAISSYCALHDDEMRKILLNKRVIRLSSISGALEQRVFAFCPNALTIQSCKTTFVTDIKPLNLLKLREMKFHHASFKSLKANILDLPNLVCISFLTCSLEEIEAGAFEKCPNLKEIYLKDCKIKEFGFEQLKGIDVVKLRALDLSKNSLNALSKEYIIKLQHIMKIIRKVPLGQQIDLRGDEILDKINQSCIKR
ncbi:hypothetical protein FZC35_02110 [Candidatus Cytomitobacter indipagum]|uniref:Leucine-rich repeat domain-containing protein n=1 Tax=Candidatus Cytomitobacter indipagum TaxID=2601575 RepID=A0A5C0UEH2_9PROT|nr:hypothetical protein [Candidatus Cytomitobacter indipagum]QEK38159.1 hypothetical protein FZC35_02110 [Candidatus Cytomitobacter indipagum]